MRCILPFLVLATSACVSEERASRAELTADRDDLTSRVAELEAALADAQTRTDAIDGRLTGAEGTITAIQTQLDAHEVSSQERHDAQQATLDAHAADLARLETARAELQASITANADALTALSASHDETRTRVVAIETLDLGARVSLTESTLDSLDTSLSALESTAVTGLTVTSVVEVVNHTSGTTRSYSNLCCPGGKRVLGVTQYGTDGSGFVIYPMDNRLDYAATTRCWSRFLHGNFGGGPVTRLNSAIYCVDD